MQNNLLQSPYFKLIKPNKFKVNISIKQPFSSLFLVNLLNI